MGRVLMRGLALIALLGGCNALLGIDDNFNNTNGGTDAGVDGPGITNHVGVAGHAMATYHTELGGETVPEDLSQWTIAAYLEDEAGLHMYPGTGKSDGTFDVPDVPARDYYLMTTTSSSNDVQVYHCTSHDLDLDEDLQGAAQPMQLALPSPLAITVPAMQRYTSSHAISLYATSDTSETQIFNWDAHGPIPGLDHLAAATTNWSGHARLGERGLWVIHSSVQYGTDYSTRSVIETAHPTGLAEVDGAPLAITTSFTPATAGFAQAIVDVPRMRTNVRGDYEFTQLALDAAPSGGTATYYGAEVAMFDYSVPARAAPEESHTVNYGDPFPNDWTRIARVTYETVPRWVWTNDHSGIAIGNWVQAMHTSPHGPGFDVPSLIDTLPPPQHPVLDGAPLVDGLRRDRTKPMHLTWDPVAGATYYVVRVLMITTDGSYVHVTATTATPELILPPNIVPERARILFGFYDYVAPPFEPAVRRLPLQSVASGVQSALLYVSATCGNGVVDPGEACDTMGESATCNFDCTKPKCGDGITNTKAHEECDTGSNSLDCDTQCRRVVCGDHKITGDEECDDGNTVDGDGCSSYCIAATHPKCGNGVIDPGEACDDGNTDDLDSCTNSCTYAQCGDGKVSIHAYEECDDGNIDTGDGCNAICRVERCGDGFVVYPEECDDGNINDGDGCSHLCKTE